MATKMSLTQRLKSQSTKKAASKPVKPEVEIDEEDLELEEALEEAEALEEELDEIEDDEDLEEDDLDDEDFEEEEEEEQPAPKKKAKKPIVKEESSLPKKKSLFTTKVKKEAELPKEGDLLTREHLVKMYSEYMGCAQNEAESAIKGLENLMLEKVFPLYSVNLFGVKFKRNVAEARVYTGVGGLQVTDNGLATEVSEHVRVTANIYIGKESRKGKLDKKGNFVPVK